MAPSIDPVPSALATFLFTSLPPNFTVGPSRLCGDRLGLWWVGCAVEAGSLVGRPGDTGSASNSNSDSVIHSGDPELTAQTDSTEAPMGKTADQKPSVQSSIWINFACRSSSRAQQNVTVQCECGEVCEGECLRVGLRVCRDIQPGTELLFYDDTVGKQQAPGNATWDTAKDEMMTQEEDPNTEVAKMSISEVKDAELKDKAKESAHEERQKRNPRKYLSRHHGRKRRVELICSSDRQSEKQAAPLTVDIDAAAGGHTGRTESGLPAEAPRGLTAPPTVRCSSRLASKPRHVHCLATRSKRPPAGPNSPEQTRGKRLNTTEDGAKFSKKKSGDPEAIAGSPTGRTPTWNSEVRERRYRCSSCGKRFYQIGHLKKHQFSHTEEKPFSCEECGKNYTSAESFRAHQMSHRGERPFSCPHCEKTYGLKRDLKEHMVLHSGEKPYACEHCGKAFARRPSLRIHRLLHCSRMTYTQPPKMQCSVCPKLLANSGSLRNHMKLHTGEKQHICQHCGKCFSQKGNLECHLRIHSGEKPFACTECGQTFSQKPELRRHMFSHTGGGFLCSYCGKSLRDPHSLRAHERLHTGERPHCCSVCGKGYTLATKLRRHMRSSHQKEKPFSCHCGASYTVRQSLLRHQAQHCSPGGATKEVESGEGCGEEANTEVPSDCGHSKPVRGRPKKRSPLPPDAGRKERGEVRRRRGRRKGEQEQKEVTLQSGETFTGEEVEDPDNVQHTIVYFHTDDLSTPNSAPLLLASEASLPAGSEQELVEVVISEGAEQCIVVHGQQPVGELLILQEEGSRLCSVAQTVEINTV